MKLTLRQPAIATLILLLALTLSSVTATSSPSSLTNPFRCPDNCECTSVQRGLKLHNHVRCTHLDDLRSVGKRTDIDSLDLSDLDIGKITNQLDKLSNLAKLDLSGNQLAEVNSLSNKHIRTLNLARNRLTTGKLLTIPMHVKHLDLSANNITELPLDFKRLSNLKSLELHGNPLNCSCDTLEVRNWLQDKSVWADKPIVCTAPARYEGKPWLQVRQSDVCVPKTENEPHSLPLGATDAADDENEMMLGDDPSVVEPESENHQEDEELSEEYLPVTPEAKKASTNLAEYSDEYTDNVSEGSGASEEDISAAVTEHSEVVNEEYEGSGDEVSEEPTTTEDGLHMILVHHDDSAVATTTEAPITEHGVEVSEEPTTTESETFGFRKHHHDSAVGPLTDYDAPVVHKFEDKEANVTTSSHQSDKIQLLDKPADQTKSSKSTYILLAVLAVLLVVLILYVACKRKRRSSKTPVDDAQSGARELLPVQKKPQVVAQNGSPEIVPLIAQNGKTGAHNGNGVSDLEGPLLQKLNEPETTDDDTKSPTAEVSYENELPQSATVSPTSPNKEYQPVSPNPSRYSPVYSPETGRIKIKLLETAKPKTPYLITRTKTPTGGKTEMINNGHTTTDQ